MNNTKMIEVVPYNPKWPLMYEIEAQLIKEALGENCVDIHHVGSTSVEGLSAKPKIDIIAVLKDISTISIQKMELIGYKYKGEYNIPFHKGFSKREDIQVNLHVFEEGNPEIELNILFRNFLRSSKEVRAEYNDLKLQLLQKKSSHEKNNSQFSGYNLGKDSFIKRVIEKTGFDGICMRFCTHYDEWEAARNFRESNDGSILDSIDHNQIHFVLYKGCKIIGYTNLIILPEERSLMQMMRVNKSYQEQGIEENFLTLSERWLKQKGILVLYIKFSSALKSFYLKQGYVEMFFNDPKEPNSVSQDIVLGKKL